MNTKVRPSFSLSYDVFPSADGHAIEYSSLRLNYIEESVEPRGRGYAVIAKSEPLDFRIDEHFASMNIHLSGGPVRYKLEVGLDREVMGNYEVVGVPTLPYGCAPLVAEVEQLRKEGNLIRFLQRRLLQNFGVDAIRTVIGDFTTAVQVQDAKGKIIEDLLSQWKKDMLPLELSGEDREQPMKREGSLNLSSPVIAEACAKAIAG